GLAKADKDEQLIRETLTHYIEGTANGEPERLKKAFHPDFNLYSTTSEGNLRIWEGRDYISRIKPGEKSNRIGRIISIDREGITATAKVEIIVPEWRVFTDYFLLVKYQNEWKIIHKSYSWRSIDQADKWITKNTKLDSIFSEVDRLDHPAVASVAIHKGEVVYMNAFGSIDLDTQTPATVNTTFQLASLSRTFTGFAILLLEEQEKLSLNDDIRKYLPSLPRYDQVITIDHLLSMTSGLPDIWSLGEVMGLTEEDVFTNEQVMHIIRQLRPTFAPGTDYIYGHTGLILLSEIVAKVSDKPFAEFMKEEIFAPLEMTNTVVVDSRNLLIPNLANLYQQVEGEFIKSNVNFEFTGS
ncbi:MAG: serine hydrolase, partial [Bacteroidota bacterium]